MSNSGFTNLTVKYADIIDVRYYVYRQSLPPHHVHKEISVGTNSGVIGIKNQRAQRQFLERLALPFRDTQQIQDWKERDAALMVALRKRQEREQKGEVYPLVFRCKLEGDRKYAWSVVTTEYSEVPVYEAKSMFENAVGNEKLQPWPIDEWQDDGIHFYRYKILDSYCKPLSTRFAQENADFCLLLRVGFAGDRAISIVPSWSFQTLLSKHYISSSRATYVFRAVHRYRTKEQILESMGKSVKDVLSKVNSLEEPIVVVTPSYERYIEIYRKLSEKYPIHIRDQLQQAWMRHYQTENGHVRMALAISDVARNYDNLTSAQRISLEQDAFRSLESN